MKVPLLYRIFLSGILIVCLVIFTLWRIEKSFLPKETISEIAPSTSGLSEVEFESGAQVKRLLEDQEKRLQSYHGDPAHDQFVEVPLDRAIDLYLKRHAGDAQKAKRASLPPKESP